MKAGRLNSKHKLYTPTSGTTIYVDYSASQKTLEVEFEGGKVYHYFKVEPEVWKQYCEIINKGESSGIYVNTRIKPFYKYKEVK